MRERPRNSISFTKTIRKCVLCRITFATRRDTIGTTSNLSFQTEQRNVSQSATTCAWKRPPVAPPSKTPNRKIRTTKHALHQNTCSLKSETPVSMKTSLEEFFFCIMKFPLSSPRKFNDPFETYALVLALDASFEKIQMTDVHNFHDLFHLLEDW